MAMKPVLALRLGQQLRMTPQLQQAIKLLQLSTFDLQQEIQEALDSNLMLEEASESDATDESTSLDTPEETIEGLAAESNAEISVDAGSSDANKAEDQPDELPTNPELDGDAVLDTSDQITSEIISDDLPIDSVWEDVWDDTPTGSYSGSDDDGDNYLENQNASSASLQTHIEEQLSLINLSEVDQMIAMSIVDGLDDNGVMTISLEEVLQSIPSNEADPVEMDEVEAVLHLIQHLDPVGIAARDLSECLAIQLMQLPPRTPWRQEALVVVKDHLSSLANRDYAYLIRKTRLKEPDLKSVIDLIQTLNPRPGSDFNQTKTEYIEPDVMVSKKNGRWTVELNPKSAPRIRVNTEYASMVRRADSSSDNTYLKNHLQEAKWFIKSLQQRNDTLLKVSTKIVEFQRGFFEYGEQAMKPLVLHDIAEAVELHESTISRVTTQKYMHTPAGVFELKYFFSSHVSTHAGGEVSSTAIRALIKKLVVEENPRKPLSDSKIANMLADQDIKVARRTIAKYRESLMIPPSNERKQLV